MQSSGASGATGASALGIAQVRGRSSASSCLVTYGGRVSDVRLSTFLKPPEQHPSLEVVPCAGQLSAPLEANCVYFDGEVCLLLFEPGGVSEIQFCLSQAKQSTCNLREAGEVCGSVWELHKPPPSSSNYLPA